MQGGPVDLRQNEMMKVQQANHMMGRVFEIAATVAINSHVEALKKMDLGGMSIKEINIMAVTAAFDFLEQFNREIDNKKKELKKEIDDGIR